MNQDLSHISETLIEISDDTSIPKNVKLKIQNVIKTLGDTSEVSIRINKALDELDEISDDVNLQPYTRTQLWNVVSSLEELFSNNNSNSH